MANDTQAKQFFNLHASGIGYLNRVRWVETAKRNGGRRAEPFLSCGINALRGSSDSPQYTYFDLKVVGEDAIQVVSDLAEAVDAERKVIVAFKAADLYIHTYERRKREDRDGRRSDEMETASLIKARLLLITSAKVDGELVYKREEPQDGDLQDGGDLREGDNSEQGDHGDHGDHNEDGGAQPGDAGDGGNTDRPNEAEQADPPARRDAANQRPHAQHHAGGRSDGQQHRGGDRRDDRRNDERRDDRTHTRSQRYARN